jgi:hypothetical protein
MNNQDQILAQDYSHAVPSQSLVREGVRQKIAEKAGDQAALLGTTSDAAALAIYGLATLVAKLATAKTLAEVNAAAAPFSALSAEFLAKVKSGEVKLPFMIKGVGSVVAGIETRATAVSDALTQAKSGGA